MNQLELPATKAFKDCRQKLLEKGCFKHVKIFFSVQKSKNCSSKFVNSSDRCLELIKTEASCDSPELSIFFSLWKTATKTCQDLCLSNFCGFKRNWDIFSLATRKKRFLCRKKPSTTNPFSNSMLNYRVLVEKKFTKKAHFTRKAKVRGTRFQTQFFFFETLRALKKKRRWRGAREELRELPF